MKCSLCKVKHENLSVQTSFWRFLSWDNSGPKNATTLATRKVGKEKVKKKSKINIKIITGVAQIKG
jgi:hypothetical protein